MRADIGPADALRVAKHLGPIDEDVRVRILSLLGVGAGPSITIQPSVGVWQATLPAEGPRVTTLPQAAATPRGPDPTPAPITTPRQSPAAGRHATRQTRIAKIQEESAVPELPAWLLAGGEALARPSAEPPPALATPPLFANQTRRAVLSTALATVVHEGDLDVGAVVSMLTDGRPLRRIPRLPTLTLRRGVQVLVDIGPGLDPYRDDVAHLLQGLDDLLPDDRLAVEFFRGTPARELYSAGQEQTRQWSPPPAAAPVLLVTDLGIGGPPLAEDRASVAEWLAFARRVRVSGHALLALVPYEARRWPPPLTRAMTILHWSERTTVGGVRRARRESRT